MGRMTMERATRTGETADRALLTIGELEESTGVTAATLRAWERRLGFPVPVRTPGGQRRYRREEAERVRRVLEERDRGLTLAAAVRAATREDQVGAQSLFASLRAAHPHLEPIRVSMRVMQALTWSIEDECLAHASRPQVYGCFQTERTYRAAGRRWRELARSASSSVAFADFDRTDVDHRPAQIALPSSSPMLNEWSLVCIDPQMTVVLAAWEPPPTSGNAGRRFEGLLSLDPAVAHDAARHCAAVCEELGVTGLPGVGATAALGSTEDPRRTASLLRRFATYADR